MERIRLLSQQREELEREAELIREILTSPGPNGQPPAGLKDPLVDAEGFPRNDIDLYDIRRKRNRLAIINTDYKTIMKEINVELQKIYSIDVNTEQKEENKTDHKAPATHQQQPQEHNINHNENQSSSSNSNSTSTINRSIALPFAIIDEILNDSPAQLSGLMNGDELIKFGSIDGKVQNPLSYIPEIVTKNVNHSINLIIRRNGSDEMTISLTPHAWSGRGLLGCHLTPIS